MFNYNTKPTNRGRLLSQMASYNSIICAHDKHFPYCLISLTWGKEISKHTSFQRMPLKEPNTK